MSEKAFGPPEIEIERDVSLRDWEVTVYHVDRNGINHRVRLMFPDTERVDRKVTAEYRRFTPEEQEAFDKKYFGEQAVTTNLLSESR